MNQQSSSLPIAAQLYTVRGQTAVDFPSVVGRLVAMGYHAFELAGYGSLASATDVKKTFDSVGASICSTHIPLESFEQNPDAVWRDGEILGCQMLVVPYIAEERRQTADDWLRLADSLNQIGRESARRGFSLSYHNHAFEFAPVDGNETAFELLWRKTDPTLVGAELDVYWVSYANADPIQWMNRLGNRLKLLHLKDIGEAPDRRFAALGRGKLDFVAITSAARRLGVKWGIVEQDDTYGVDPFDCLHASLNHLKSVGLLPD